MSLLYISLVSRALVPGVIAPEAKEIHVKLTRPTPFRCIFGSTALMGFRRIARYKGESTGTGMACIRFFSALPGVRRNPCGFSLGRRPPTARRCAAERRTPNAER